ncbi:Cysteine desulfurase NifS [bacterium HR40]|nr:Cysteine desulfurase NifS [bacterium HR40]
MRRSRGVPGAAADSPDMSGRGSRVYLDHNATSWLRPEAREAILACLDEPGNPSSVHADGRRARARLEKARERLAAVLGVAPAQLVFTSGGSEADNLGLHQTDRPVLVSAIEHPAVLAARADAIPIPVEESGIVDLDALEALLVRHRPGMVAVMLANNETGVIQPVAEVARRVHAHGALLHVDAVQALGKLDFRLDELGADFLAVSAHKLGGPVGIGALVVREGLALRPLVRGGGQERGRRAGTENVAAAVGFAAALAAWSEEEKRRLARLRDRMEEAMRDQVPEARIIGLGAPRLPNTSCVALPGVDAVTQLVRLDLAGISVSAGSACSSGRIGRSHVLAAMGLPPAVCNSAIRISLGWSTTAAEIERFVEAWTGIARALLPARGLALVPARPT